MSKELEPTLFGEGAWASSRVLDKSPERAQTSEAAEKKLIETRNELRALKDLVREVAADTDSLGTSADLKFDKITQRLENLERIQSQVAREVTQKVAQLHAKLSDRAIFDRKLQDLIDKQNAILRTYEIRFTTMQKLLAEKEAQAVSSMATLNEAKAEIMRLKRF